MNKIQDPPAGIYFLYADDDPDDQDFFKMMIHEADPETGVVIVNNGLELIQFLDSVGEDGNKPCCIILDINMPVWDGIRTLKALKVDERLKTIPVVMFTTSMSLRDNELCLRLGAQAFITKPIRQTEFKQLYSRFTDACNQVNG